MGSGDVGSFGSVLIRVGRPAAGIRQYCLIMMREVEFMLMFLRFYDLMVDEAPSATLS